MRAEHPQLDNDRAFVKERTKLRSAPLCPEIDLYLADELMPIWEALEECAGGINSPPPYWAFCWPGGQALARCVLDRPDLVKDLRVLDFGAGGAIAAIASVKSGAHQVTAVDIDPMAAHSMSLNADINNVSFEIIIGDLIGQKPQWDVVLVGDLCYEKNLAEPMMSWLENLAKDRVNILLADPGRAYLPGRGLLSLAEYRVPTSLELESAEYLDTSVYRLLSQDLLRVNQEQASSTNQKSSSVF